MKKLVLWTLTSMVAALVCITGYVWYTVTQPWTQPGTQATQSHQADKIVLQSHVYKLATDFADRHYRNLTRLEGAASYIEAELLTLGLQVQSQRFQAKGRPYRNLVVQLGPASKDVTVVGAHYDVAGEQPGADDNASGVAGLLELARLLKAAPLRHRVELVFYTNEEPPFFRTPSMGSAIHAASLSQQGNYASLMLSIECIGYFSDLPGSQEHPVRMLNMGYPTVGNFISLVGFYEDGAISRRVKSAMQGATSLPVHSVNAPGFVVGIDFSDHLNYHSEGFVGMMVTDTAFYRNKAYHTQQDTADRLDYTRMGQVVNAVQAAVIAHDSRP